ncbi:MAG: redoxin family protein [Chitinophagales bacterium]
MRTIILTLVSLSAIIAITPVYAQNKINPGDDLPSIKTVFRNANGNSTALADAFGQNGLLVMFSSNTCQFVIKNQPITKKVMEFAAAHNVGMAIINANEGKRDGDDSYEAMKKYAKEQGYTVPYLVDENSALADMFGATHTPEVYLFSKQHKLVYKGAMNDNPSNPDGYKKMYIEDAINAMIAGKEVDPKTTRSIGCGIKRKT